MMHRYHPGYCKCCEQPTYEIRRQFPIGHPLAGRPVGNGIGPPLRNAVKVTMLLTNGTFASLTLHRECLDHLGPDRLPELWRTVLGSARFEHDNRLLIGAAPLKSEQKWRIEKDMLSLTSVRPLGVIDVELLGEAIDG